MINFDPATLSPFFSVRLSTAGITTGQGQPLIAGNASRVLLAISTLTNGVFITPYMSQPQGVGLLVPVNGLMTVLKFSDWGGIVGNQWFASTTIGMANVTIVEVDYTPPG